MTFLEELQEVFQDLAPDVSEPILSTDIEVMQVLCRMSMNGLTAGGDVQEVVNRLASLMLWMVLIGREHSTRGYAAPLVRTTTDVDGIPDYVIEILREMGDEHG